MKSRKERTREAILVAALQQFSAKGIGTISLEEIAESANIARRTLYYHFRDKNELLHAIIDPQLKQALGKLENRELEILDLRVLARFCLQFWLDNSGLLRVMDWLRKEKIDNFSQFHDSFIHRFGILFDQAELKKMLRFQEKQTNINIIFYCLFPLLHILSEQPDFKDNFIDIFMKTLGKS